MKRTTPKSKNVATVLSLLKNEIDGHAARALLKLAPDYSMTWVYRSPKTGKLFPRSRRTSSRKFEHALKSTYRIKGRSYNIRNIATGRQLVMIEMVESYHNPKTARIYRTPLVIVLEFRNGLVRTGRHYCDPTLSHLNLSKRDVERAFIKN